MKLSLVVSLFMVFLSSSAFAQQAPQAVRFLLAYGSEYRPEKDVNADYAQHFLANYAIGAGYESFLFTLERATFEESSGAGSLKVDRHYEDTMIWAQWRTVEWNHLVPFLAAGLGAYQEKIKTDLGGTSVSENETKLKLLTGAGFGVSINLPILWISLEGRALFGDELDQQPTLGGLARIGLWLP